jgi:hypothetical protein
MVKLVLAGVAAATLCMSNAAGQSLVQRSDWQDRKFETYLPKLAATVPWLEIDTKTRLPKGDIPLGRDVASVGPLVLPPADTDIRVFTNVIPAFRSM